MVLEKVKHANENGNLISELQTRQRRIINLAHQLCTVLTYESRYNFSDLCNPSFIMMVRTSIINFTVVLDFMCPTGSYTHIISPNSPRHNFSPGKETEGKKIEVNPIPKTLESKLYISDACISH